MELNADHGVGWQEESPMTDKFALLQRQVHQGQPHYKPARPAGIAPAHSPAQQQQQPQALLPDKTCEDSEDR
jgi:hypothetical protein